MSFLLHCLKADVETGLLPKKETKIYVRLAKMQTLVLLPSMFLEIIPNKIVDLIVHPNISLHILHTVLYTFPEVLTGRICLTVKNFFS